MNTRALRRRFSRMGGAVYVAARAVAHLYRRTVMGIARLGGFKKNRAVFLAFDARSYSDNPRCISEKLHEMRPETEIVWMFREFDEKRKLLPGYAKAERWMSIRSLAALATARVTVANFSFRPFFRFRKPEQVYVQTWHGDRAFKKVGFDMHPEKDFLLEMECDLGLIGSDYGEKQFRSAFRYGGELLRAGYPRNDILVRNDPAEAAEIRRALGIPEGVKLMLYAPTFRDELLMKGQRHRAEIDLNRALEALERRTGDRWMCLFRAHYLSAGLAVDAREGRIVNAARHEEMAELLLIADALVTDYSSCAGDFALTGRPIFLFQDDLEDYRTKSRELYFDIGDSPYLVARTQAELEKLIENMTDELAAENDRAILDFYGTTETGRAAEAACEYIIKKLDGN